MRKYIPHNCKKYKVENIIERLVENKSKDELQFKNIGEYKTKSNRTRRNEVSIYRVHVI